MVESLSVILQLARLFHYIHSYHILNYLSIAVLKTLENTVFKKADFQSVQCFSLEFQEDYILKHIL